METNRSGRAPFRAHARLIRLLGEELISDETVAVIELVKNSYDADARKVTICLERLTEPEQGSICIIDDGAGMSLETVLHSWLEPATSQKRSRNGIKIRTLSGRVPLGEKGIGRFAVDKLGSVLELVTREPDSSNEVVLQVNWADYEKENYLDEIENSWLTRPVEYFGEDRSGTALTIRCLRLAWNRAMIARLHEGLVRLTSPFTTGGDFIIELECSEFPEFSGVVVNRLLESAPYRLSGWVDPNGILTIDSPTPYVLDLRTLNREHFTDADGRLRQALCGLFTINLNVWDLEAVNVTTPGMSNTLRRIIKSRSGVSIYRDGFRVLPYGEKDNDWLELNQRRVNNPTLRVSNNQVIGLIEVTHDSNPQLRDRTSREGLLDGPALTDLKVLVVTVLSLLETKRFEQRHVQKPITTPVSARKDDAILQYLHQANDKPGQSAKLSELERLYVEKIEQDKIRYAQVVRLAGSGMAAELMTDLFAREVHNTSLSLRTLLGYANGSADPTIQALLGQLNTHVERLNEQLDLMQPLYRPLEHQESHSTVRGVLYDVFTMVAPQLAKNNVRVTLDDATQLTVHIGPGYLMQVFIVLLQNSLAAFKDGRVEKPQISVTVVSGNGFHGIYWSDNGPGVSTEIEHLIFRPHFSTRRAGRGLGLSVIKDVLAAHGAILSLHHGDCVLPGACFEIQFDGRRVSRARSD